MRKLLALMFFLIAAFPAAAGKDDDVTTCVLPVSAHWTNMSARHVQLGKPPQAGEFFVDIKMYLPQGNSSAATSGNLEGYVGVACDTPGAVKTTFHHTLLQGWEAKPAN